MGTYDDRHLLLFAAETLPSDPAAERALRQTLEGCKNVLFLPYAAGDYDEAYATYHRLFEANGLPLTDIETRGNRAWALVDADAVVVGDGNMFRLFDTIHEFGLGDEMHRALTRGWARYVGFGAGTVLAGRSLAATADFPVVAPPDHQGLRGLALNVNIPREATQREPATDEQVAQIHIDQSAPVLSMPSGTWLEAFGRQVVVRGATARVHTRNADPLDVPADGTLPGGLER